ELHALLQAVGQPRGDRLADRLDLEEVDDPLDSLAVRELLAARRSPPQRVEEEASAHLQEPARHDVVEYGHALEERHVLERARDAELRDVRRAQMRPVLAVEADVSLVRPVEPADDV